MVKVAAMLVRMCVPDVALELHSDLQKKERKKSLGNTILREKKIIPIKMNHYHL